MRYTQSKEKSAELLRAALALMGQHDAAFNPLAFAVWYEHSAGINAKLSTALAECLRAEPRLGDETIARLYRQHVGEADESAVRTASGALDRVMSAMAETAARTGDRAGAFVQTLNGLGDALGAKAVADLDPLISRTIEGTTQIRDVAVALQQQVAAGRAEIERLRSDLSRVRDEALIDPLTRVLNRKGFDEKFAAMLAQTPRPGGTHCIAMFDIDRFKSVNDTYGHVMGDRVLQAVGEVLRTAVTNPAHSVARYGGEEFAVLVPHSEPDAALALAQACRERVKALKVRDRRSQSVVLTVTISAGVAALRPDDDATSLVVRADKALYAAKQAGRDRVVAG